MGRNRMNDQRGELGDDTGHSRGHHADMSLPPDQPTPPSSKLSAEERRARQADRLAPIRLAALFLFEEGLLKDGFELVDDRWRLPGAGSGKRRLRCGCFSCLMLIPALLFR